MDKNQVEQTIERFEQVDTFRPPGLPKLQYSDLYNGVFLCDVMQQIDPRPAYNNVNRLVRDVNIRLQNWDILVKNIRAYYLDVLQQLLIVKLPNVQTISRDPDKDVAFNELKKVLLLVLGCAVQCERKEEFIETIMALELTVQHEIVESIKQITDDSESILPTECQDVDKVFNHLARLIKERDDYSDVMAELAQERDFYQAQADGKSAMPVSPTGSPEKHHMVVELTDCKAKIRKLRQELEEKQEQLSDIQDEVEDQKATVAKLRNENVDLVKDARSARSLRDEIDILREKMGQANEYEAEILKYKEKLNEMDFYKARVEELREDNAILIESKGMLEEHLSNSHKRISTVVQLEQELIKYRQQIEEMNQERDTDRERIQILAEENAQLQFHKKISMNESTNLEQEIAATKAKIAGVGGAISDQLKETTNAKILRLELENQNLQRKIEDMRESSLIENTTLNLELEKETQRLSNKVEKLQHANKQTSQKCLDVEEYNRALLREKEHFVQTIELTKESAERQIRELEQQNEDLSQTVDVIRVRSEQTNDTKLKDLEKENKRLHETLSVKNQHLSKAEFENRQLQKSLQRTRHNSDKITELENEKDSLEREKMELQHRLQTQELMCEKSDRLEQDVSDLEVENNKLQRKVQSLQTTIQKKEKYEQENINLTVENQKLNKMLDNLKHSSAKLVEVDNENSLLKKELQQQQKSIEMKKSQSIKLEKMELDLMDLDNENMKLQRSLEITTNRVQQLEKDNSDLENELEKLQDRVESSKYSQKRLIGFEKENSELEQECMKIQKGNAVLTKENKRFKVTLESRESAIDELNTRCSVLDMENKEVKRQLELQKDSNSGEVEKEQRELLQSINMEKQTVATLRADLVNEKIRSQKLTNELDRVHQELERIGIRKDQLLHSSQSRDDNRLKALENMMDTELKKSTEIKDEKIQALQSRLEESKNRNLRLQEDLRLTKREFESMKQRHEEEALGKEKERQEVRHVRNSPFMNQPLNQPLNQPNATRDILDMKDQLIKVERSNATLIAENNNLKTQTNSLNHQIKKLETQNSTLQSQTSSMQGQSGALQSQNAKLQVENSTLQSQCASLHAQNSTLQTKVTNAESDYRKLNQLYKSLQDAHNQLVADHNMLQNIHEQSSAEYEGLISEHGSLKSIHKNLRSENRELQDRINNVLHGKDDENKIRDVLHREREQLQMECKSLGNLQMNYNKLRDDFDGLTSAHESLQKDHHETLEDYKQHKTDHNLLQKDYAEAKEQLRVTETNFNLLANKYDSLFDNCQMLSEDKEQLMKQVEMLIGRNQDLLGHVLGSKDQMGVKEKQYMEQLSDLRRQKERLEEKIMDHYKNREKVKKNKSLGAILMQKVRGLTKEKRSKSRPNLHEGSPDNSSLGSGSYADANDHDFSRKSITDKRRHRRPRRGSAGHLTHTDSPSLSSQTRGLAKSTTALHDSPDSAHIHKSMSVLRVLRGARSTEDLLSDTLRSHGDSMSLSSSTFMLLPGMGRPASDDEGGFTKDSPVGDMMTMEEFLSEGLDKTSPKPRRKLEKEETESRSSENSDGSARRRKPAPLPPTQLSLNRNRIGSIPDVAVVSQTDLSMSRMSRVSTGSSGSSQDIRVESAFTQLSSPSSHMHPNNTSTPAKPPSQFRPHKHFEDLNNSAFSRIHPGDDRRNLSSYEPVGSSRNNVSSSRNSHHSDTPDGHSPKYPSTREQTPERDTGGTRLTPDARLDNLTRGNSSYTSPSQSQMSLSSGWSPASNYSSPRDQRSHAEGDLSVRSAQGRPDSAMSPQENVPGHGQRPMKAVAPAFPRSHSPGRTLPQPQQPSDRNPTSPPTPTRKSNILVSRANVGPRPYGQKNVIRARPASAFGAPMNNSTSFQGDNSVNTSLNNSRTSINNSKLNNSQSERSGYNDSYGHIQNNAQQNGPTLNSPPTYTARQPSIERQERPKSVPPSMFNMQSGSDSDSNYINNNNSDYSPTKTTPPVPPPRKASSNRFSVLREPSASNSPPNQPMTSYDANTSQSRAPLNNAQSALKSQSSRGQIARIGPQQSSRPAHNKPPAPKPMKPEEPSGENKNSICLYTPSIEV